MSEAERAEASDASGDAVRILCVDDEPRVLDGLDNHLSLEYDVHLAGSGAEALELIESHGPFAVVLSDMRMPQMDGAAFLHLVQQRHPDTTRMLLTGYADVQAASAAINEGGIFRFLSKPCEPARLLAAVAEGVRQYQLVRAEVDLLEQTLRGAVRVLTEVMSLTSPAAFSRVSALERYIRHLCDALGIADTWPYELAATLAQLGCITLPVDTQERALAGQTLEASEQAMVDGHPEVAGRLLERIPRLEVVAEMIRRQNARATSTGRRLPTTPQEMADLGGRMLAVALAFDRRIVAGDSPTGAVERLQFDRSLDRRLLSLLQDLPSTGASDLVRVVPFADLRPFMVLDENLVCVNGNTIVPRGRELNRALIERLRNFATGVGIAEPIRVRIPV